MIFPIKYALILVVASIPTFVSGFFQVRSPDMDVTVEWNKGSPSGNIGVTNGSLALLEVIKGKGVVRNHTFRFSRCPCALKVSVGTPQVQPGPGATIISIKARENPFSFLLRDVSTDYPIFIPDFNLAVFPSQSNYSFEKVAELISKRDLKLALEEIDDAPEETFESIAIETRKPVVPTLLGIGRDIRHFQIEEVTNNSGGEVSLIVPLNKSGGLTRNGRQVNFSYAAGRGQGNNIEVRWSLEQGYLPILHTTLSDGDIDYKSTKFTTLERSALRNENVKGTNFLVADHYSAGNMITPGQQELLNTALANQRNLEEETVLYFRTVAVNKGHVPRYAWVKTIKPGRGWWDRSDYRYDPSTGFSSYAKDSVFCISLLNGKALSNEEISILLSPGDSAIFDFYIPHSPLSEERAVKLKEKAFAEQLKQCIHFWNQKIKSAASISLPEKRIEQMLKAGLVHLDLVTYGEEPSGTLAPTIGVYSPIGTESAPIIQFYNSMGKNDWARRSLQFFLDKQHPDGMMQNFGGYMIETGAALWSIGEYIRYTNDTVWLRDIKPKIILSCDYLLQWRNKNKAAGSKSYGLIDGKVADPEDPFHQFMLNGYAYLGISRAAEILLLIDPVLANKMKDHAAAWKADIRKAFFESTAGSPVVPLGDGTWCRTTPPWTEAQGLRSLYLSADRFFSHGTFTVSDALLGPLYLIFCEVLSPDEPASRDLIKYHTDLFYQNNTAFSQPYYSRHDWIQLRMGMVKPFLKTYYTQMAALADRETYSFWEHFYHVSPHKTHEEAWFLLSTRWLLYLEEEETLQLLKGAPRNWFRDGDVIDVQNAASYFGSLSFKVESHVKNNYIAAVIENSSSRKPKRIIIRVPHPEGKAAIRVEGGTYNSRAESVVVDGFTGSTTIKVYFAD